MSDFTSPQSFFKNRCTSSHVPHRSLRFKKCASLERPWPWLGNQSRVGDALEVGSTCLSFELPVTRSVHWPARARFLKVEIPFWAFRLGRAVTGIVGCSPDKPGPMLLISSWHEKQTATKPRASRDREFHISEESSLAGITSVPSISGSRRGQQLYTSGFKLRCKIMARVTSRGNKRFELHGFCLNLSSHPILSRPSRFYICFGSEGWVLQTNLWYHRFMAS